MSSAHRYAERECRRLLARLVPNARIYFPRSGKLPRTYTWNGRHLHPSGKTLESQIHDVVHVLIAPDSRRLLPECGLGPDPYRISDAPCVLSFEDAQKEEILTCRLQVALAKLWDLHYEAAERELNVQLPDVTLLGGVHDYAPWALDTETWDRLWVCIRRY